MQILIIEDEARIATRIERMLRDLCGPGLKEIHICDSLEKGKQYLMTIPVDLLFLDLNLNGEDGFNLLKECSAEPYHTVIISAYHEKAITAFEYGVLDFIPKPFTKERLEIALKRFTGRLSTDFKVRFLPIKHNGYIQSIEIADILFIKGSNIYTEVHIKTGAYILHTKSLEKLEQLLSSSFIRVHKSYLLPKNQVKKLSVSSKGQSHIVMENGLEIPVGRTYYESVKGFLFGKEIE